MSNATIETAAEQRLAQRLAQREQAENELRLAEQALGAAVLDGKGEAEARKRLERARQVMEALTVAAGELDRRETEAERATRERALASRRAEQLKWRAKFLRQQLEVKKLRDQLAVAEDSLLALGSPAPHQKGANREADIRAFESELEEVLGPEIARRVPKSPTRQRTGNEVATFRRLSTQYAVVPNISTLSEEDALTAAAKLDDLAATYAKRAG